MKNRIICFIGTDGSGKSTLISKTKKKLEENKGIKVKEVYFGWKPFLPTTKLLSFILKKRKYQIADEMNNKSKNTEKSKISLFQEVMLSYYYIEYLSRYLFQLKLPFLFTKEKVILVDRYFYDMYAHYRYASTSNIFPILLTLMPKPKLTIFLDVDVETAKQRKPEMDINLLQEHHQRYQQLSKLINVKTVKTNQNVEHSVQEVMEIVKIN